MLCMAGITTWGLGLISSTCQHRASMSQEGREGGLKEGRTEGKEEERRGGIKGRREKGREKGREGGHAESLSRC